MKAVAVGLYLVLSSITLNGQTDKAAEHVIEGGKVVVELIKALSTKKDMNNNSGCKKTYADLCIMNESNTSLIASIQHRATGEKREMVIQPKSKECSLHVQIGVWTYDLRIQDNIYPIRKGDILIESCQNLMMNIKF